MIHTILKHVALIVMYGVASLILMWVGLSIYGTWHDEWSGYNASGYIGDGYCNIAVLPVLGEIHSYGAMYDEFGNLMVSTNMRDSLTYLNQAETELGILGVLVLVDSPGGSPAAGGLISARLKESTLPSAAFIVDRGTSAGYHIASGADTIIASPFSDVGSIGVTMSYLDYSRQNADSGIDYVSLASGKFKDYGSPDKPLTDEERALLERDLSIWHDEFVRQVAANRNLPIEDVATIADGSSVPASLALEKGLIDKVGGLEDVRAWFAEQLALTPEEVVFCQ